MTEERFTRLVEAVRAYDAALRVYGAMSSGEQWVQDTPALDDLWNAVLEAAGLKEAHDT